MSSSTWTPDALSSNARSLNGTCWRAVEAQHLISTMKITDSLQEQDVIEALIEQTKPSIPAECRHLSFLLFTPFRYPLKRRGSRFRREGSPGVFYASEHVDTAIAEIAFYRLLFFAESPLTPCPSNPGEYTAFETAFLTTRAIDLTVPPLLSDRMRWTQLADYAACQALADAARAADLDVIKYQSVRDVQGRANLAVLRCRAFSEREERHRQTWRLHIDAGGIRAVCEAPRTSLAFGRMAFSADPRMAGFTWDR